MNQPNDISAYVLPVFLQADAPRSFQGTAFCVNGYLITAGHVLRYPRTYYVCVGNRYVPLRHDKWIPRQVPSDDQLGYDVALYPVPELESPLSLSEEDAKSNDGMEAICWQMIDGTPTQVRTTCVVRGEDDNEGYFRMSTVDRITHGASGCPIIKDGKVYGLLAMGRDYFENRDGFITAAPEHRHLMQRFEENTCWVFKTSHIKRFMPENDA